MKEAKKLGIKILGTEAYTADTTDFKPQLTKFKMMKPDAIFIPGYAPQGTLIISQARSLGIKNVAFFGADGLDDELMVKNPDTEGLFVTTPFSPPIRPAPELQALLRPTGKSLERILTGLPQTPTMP